MIIYFEGHSCAGKTSLIHYMAEKYGSKILIVEELPISLQNSEEDISVLCRHNDIDKVRLALLNDRYDLVVLVDRCYLSSICYHYTKWKT